jgi:hypothetical protein
MDHMHKALLMADAPQRQLRGVNNWRRDIGAAVCAAQPFRPPPRPLKQVTWRRVISDTLAVLIAPASTPDYAQRDLPGLHIDDRVRMTVLGPQRPPAVRFLHGHRTHRAWKELSWHVVGCLQRQEQAANEVLRLATKRRWKKAAEDAAVWMVAANTAATTGLDLIAVEDAIMRPVGLAIRKAGGRHEVAQDKHYHDRSSTALGRR